MVYHPDDLLREVVHSADSRVGVARERHLELEPAIALGADVNLVFEGLRDSREKACEDAASYKRWLTKLNLNVEEGAFLINLESEQGLWNALKYTVTKTANDVVIVAEKAVTPSAWPTWLKVVGGIAAIAGAAYVVNSFTTAARVVRGR